MKAIEVYMVKLITSHEDDGLGCHVYMFDTAAKCNEFFNKRVKMEKKSIIDDFDEHGVVIDFEDSTTYDAHFYYYEDAVEFTFSRYAYQDEVVIVKDEGGMEITEEEPVWVFGKEEE